MSIWFHIHNTAFQGINFKYLTGCEIQKKRRSYEREFVVSKFWVHSSYNISLEMYKKLIKLTNYCTNIITKYYESLLVILIIQKKTYSYYTHQILLSPFPHPPCEGIFCNFKDTPQVTYRKTCVWILIYISDIGCTFIERIINFMTLILIFSLRIKCF